MATTNDKDKDSDHRRRMAEIREKYANKHAKKIRIWKFIKKLFGL